MSKYKHSVVNFEQFVNESLKLKIEHIYVLFKNNMD